MRVQSCCFANLNQSLFHVLVARRRSAILISQLLFDACGLDLENHFGLR